MGIGRRINDEDFEKQSEEQLEHLKKKSKTKEIVFAPEDAKYSIDDIIVPESVKGKLLDVMEYNNSSHVVFEQWGLNKTHRYDKRIGIN